MSLLDSALKILSHRPHSKQEVLDFLRKKTSDTALINQTVSKLEDLKLINDEEFAKWLIESRSRSKPRGVRLLKQELKQKGIDMEVNVNEVELAERALNRKHPKSREQAIRFLQFRGFSWDAITKVVKKAYNTSHVS